MADIVYSYAGSIYLNLTNSCPCQCVFCIRNNMDALGSAHELWHKHEPSWEEIRQAIDEYDWTDCREAVFCGYGEPTCALDNLLKAAQYLRDKLPGMSLRINTNGLSDLIHGRPTAQEICRVVDRVSISLNAPDAARYVQVTQPEFGEESFDAMLKFARECKEYGKKVAFSVVSVITPEEVERCQQLADSMGILLRVREYED